MNVVSKLALFVFVTCVASTSAAQYETILSVYETRYAARHENAGRAKNIKLAAGAINGYVVMPGEVFSYNEVVGRRSRARGYKDANMIVRGKLVESPGGGVCQVSSTLHAAVMYAGLEIVERYPHSRALSYIEPSLDATVSWGTLDFKFRNDLPTPVRIAAATSVTKRGGLLVVKLLSTERRRTVSISIETKKRRPYDVEYVEVDDLLPGVVDVVEPGTYGYIGKSTRVIIDAKTGNSSFMVEEFRYRKTNRVVHTGKKRRL